MSDKLQAEYNKETDDSCFAEGLEISLSFEYLRWLESQLEQARADKVEFLEFMKSKYKVTDHPELKQIDKHVAIGYNLALDELLKKHWK